MNSDSDLLFRSLFRQAAAPTCLIGVDGTLIAANDRFAARFPPPAGGYAGAEMAAVFGEPALAEALGRMVDKVLIDGTSSRENCPGANFGELVIGRPLRDDDEAIIAIALCFEVDVVQEVSARVSLLTEQNEHLRRQLSEMEFLASTDRLTGTWNRRRFEDTAVVEMSRAERYEHPVTMLMLDLDHFKQVNDEFGHAAGDLALKAVADELRRGIRKADSIARWGGEEFIVLAPNTRLAEATRLGEKLRARISQGDFADLPHLTVSIGIAEYLRGEGLEAWMARVDRALYAAKHGGRDRVVADPLTSQTERPRPVAPVSVLRLVWHDSYLSGHPLIDAQHQKLFELANRLLDCISAGEPLDRIVAVVSELFAETAAHFADEEGVHRDLRFPGAGTHAREHAQLVAKGTRLGQYVRKGTMSPSDLFQFLAYEVIAQHMLGSDRKFAAFLNREDASVVQ